jgi:hypothetical protein
MEPILIIVTALALALAVAMAIVVVVMLKQEKARSDARIEALSAFAGDLYVPPAEPVRSTAASFAEPVRPARVPAQPAPRVAPEPITLRENVVSPVDDDDLEIRSSIAGVSDLFAEPERPSPWVNRLVAIGCLAAIALAVGLAATTIRSHQAGSTVGAATTQAPAKVEAAPLELLALRHTQESDRIVVTGLVQNPRTGQPIGHVAATVFVFGPDGAFLSSNQAPLDFTTLTPGGESQFVVSVPVKGPVARYRVGFRTEDGRVLPHVDKRGPDALAQK